MDRAELRAIVRATGCAEERGEMVFLCDPKWTEAQRELARAVMGAEQNPEARGQKPEDGGVKSDAGRGWLCLPTGGTSGGIKFARHDEETLGAAVSGFCEHFGIERVNAIGVLPPYHVSGLMAQVRCTATGGTHVAWDWKRLEAGEWPELASASSKTGKAENRKSGKQETEDELPDAGDWVISLVPTQLQRLLAIPAAVAWLRGLRIIFLGGGPVWPELAETAAREGLRVSLSYGMTETAAMVAALRPEEFLAGARSSGRAMPQAQVGLTGEGLVRISGPSCFFGYWPDWRAAQEVVTEDLAEIDAEGYLHVLGRRDAVIITGGKKVQPLEVEAVLRASGEFADVAVIGVPDAEWGQRVVACYPVGAEIVAPRWRIVETVMTRELSAWMRPKQFVALSEWPRSAQGKLNRAVLAAAVMKRQEPEGGR